MPGEAYGDDGGWDRYYRQGDPEKVNGLAGIQRVHRMWGGLQGGKRRVEAHVLARHAKITKGTDAEEQKLATLGAKGRHLP